MNCDPEEMRVLAGTVKDVVEARFPSDEYEDFLEQQHGKGRLSLKLDPSIQPGRIEVQISCSQLLRSLNVKLMRLNKPAEVKEFAVTRAEVGQSNEALLRDLREWLQSF